MRATGSLDTPLPDLVAMKGLGLNIVGLSDFHGDMHLNDPGALRFQDEKDYAEAARRASDKDFLVVPWEEPNVYFGGHYNVLFPKPVYFSRVRKEGQPFTENDPVFGKVYHLGSSEDLLKLLETEHGFWYTSHPRTKSSGGQPDVYLGQAVREEQYLPGTRLHAGDGDGSIREADDRIPELRRVGHDEQPELEHGTDAQGPARRTSTRTRRDRKTICIPAIRPAYLKLDRVPGPDEDWSPVLRAMRDGNFFVTTGEILIPKFAVEGSGVKRTIDSGRELDVSTRVHRSGLG